MSSSFTRTEEDIGIKLHLKIMLCFFLCMNPHKQRDIALLADARTGFYNLNQLGEKYDLTNNFFSYSISHEVDAGDRMRRY